MAMDCGVQGTNGSKLAMCRHPNYHRGKHSWEGEGWEVVFETTLCPITGYNGHSRWSRQHIHWTCSKRRNHSGDCSWRKEGRFKE